EPPPLPEGLLPEVIEDFAFEQADIMGCDPAIIAASALAVCAAAIPDATKLQVKKHDTNWKESARLWVGIVGEPSVMKTPAMALAVKPLHELDAHYVRRYMRAKEEYDKAKSD